MEFHTELMNKYYMLYRNGLINPINSTENSICGIESGAETESNLNSESGSVTDKEKTCNIGKSFIISLSDQEKYKFYFRPATRKWCPQ